MTFRESGNLDTSGVSGGGSGGRGRGVAIGGGIGGLVITVVALLLGVDLDQLGPEQPAGGGTAGQGSSASREIDERIAACTLAKANSDTICRIVATTESLEDVWSAQFPAQTGGQRYIQPHTNIFAGSIDTGCGAATSAVGPFYCPADNEVYIDPSFYDRVLVQQLGGSDAPSSQMYVLAHEFGHHIQTLLGDIRRSQQDPQGESSGAVRVELQADCYAGIWAHHATTTPAPGGQEPLLERLTDEDIDAIIRSAEAIGDDHIQKMGGGRVDPDSWTHGSSQMRRDWFTAGYRSGSMKACNTFDARL